MKKSQVIFVSILLLLAFGLGSYAYAISTRSDTTQKNSYNYSFSELVNYVNNIENYLAKAMISKSSKHSAKTLTKIWNEANLAVVYMENIPFDDKGTSKSIKFLNQVSDYAYTLSRKSINGEELSNDDFDNLNKLYSLVCSLTNFIKQYSEYTNLRTSNNLSLFIPNIEDYWYLKKIQEDPKTMSYNAGYDVNYLGYDYDTGCIELKESSWEDEFNKKKDKGIFLAYIKDEELKDYIGYVTYHYNEFEKRYYCGVLIEFKYRSRSFGKKALSLLLDFARKNNIKTLYNSFEEDRADAIKLFTNMGFSIVGSKIVNKFNSPTKSLIIKIDL